MSNEEELQEGVMQEVKRIMVEKNLQRSSLVDFLSLRMSRSISEVTVASWFRPSRPDRFPSLMVLFFICEFLTTYEPLNIALRQFRHEIVTSDEHRLIGLGEQLGVLFQQADSMHGGKHRRPRSKRSALLMSNRKP